MSEKIQVSNISSVDKNFVVPGIGNMEILFRNVSQEPFCVEGLPWAARNPMVFSRAHADFTEKNTNSGVMILVNHTAGACVRFCSDSSVVVLRGKLACSFDMNHMPRTGSSGFDCYRKLSGQKLIFHKSYGPEAGIVEFKTLIGENKERKMYDWQINFPLYGGVEFLEIGLTPDARLAAPAAHAIAKPILFYGSSITQGGCASRPGNCYPAMLCRSLDAPQINLGFSGSAQGEDIVAQAIRHLDMSVMVYDYDHNAPSIEHLARTHERFFRIIREAQELLPVVMISRCDYDSNPELSSQRREIIRTTWQNAVKQGDKHVYFIDGETLFGSSMRDSCTVDGCHPNDLGFYRMYEHILPVVQQALQEDERTK